MASNNEDIKWLYDKLKAKGYNIGSEGEFTNSLANEEDRQWYYDKATGMGLNMGSIDDFNELYAPKTESKTKEAPAEAAAAPATSTVHTQQQTPKVSAPLATGVRLPNAGIQRALGQQPTIEDMPQPQAQPQVGEFARQQVEQFNKAVNANRAEMFKQPALRDEIGDIKAEKYNPDAVAAMERAYTSFKPKTIEEQIADIEKRIDQRQKELYNEKSKQGPTASFVFGAGAAPAVPKANINEDDQELRSLIAARDQLKEAKEAKKLGDADVADNKAGNTGLWGFFKGAGRGFASSVFDVTTWDFGVSDLSNNTQLLEVAQKAERGDKLTQAEEDLLTAASINAAAQSYLSEVGGYGTTAGKITGESLPFMLEFAINPLSGSSSSIAKYGAKKFGVTALKKGIGKKLAKAGLRTAGDVAAAAGMTATTGATRVAADATQRMTGNIMPTYDEFGYIQYEGSEGAEDNWATATGKAAGSAVIENYSEMLGNQFAPILGAVGGKISSVIPKNIKLNKVTEIISDINGSSFARGFNEFLQRTQWHGPVGEYFEEVASNVLNATFVGDMKFDASEEGVFNLENNIDTFLGVALMGGAFSAINTVGYAVEKADNMRVNRQLKNQSVRMSEMLGDKWAGVRDQIDNAEDEQLVSLLTDITYSNDYTAEQKKGIWQYAAKLKASQGANMVRLEQQIGGEFSPELNDVMESYDAGYKAQLTEAAAVKAAYDDAVSAYEQKYEPIGDDINYAITEAINVGDTERRDALVDVAKKRAAYEGIKQQARDNAEDRIAASNMRIDRLSNQGNIISATLKDGDKPIYITSGNVQVNSDNTLNISDSSSFMVAQTPEGEIITVSPDQILRIDAISPASEQKYLIEQMIWQEEAQNIANVENGSVSVQPGETYTVINDYGEPIDIQVIRDNMDGTYLINDGMQNVNMNSGQLQQMLQQSMVANARTLREQQEAQRQQQNAAAVESAPVEQSVIEQPAAEETATEQPTEQQPQPIMVGDEFTNAAGETGIVQSVDSDGAVITWEREDGSSYTNRMTAEDIAAMQAPTPAQAEVQAETAATPSPEELQAEEQAQTTAEQTPESVIAEMQDFEPEERQVIVNNNIQAAEQAYNDILSAKPVPGMDIAAFRLEKAEWQANVEQAKANLDFWNNVNALLNAPAVDETAAPEATEISSSERTEMENRIIDWLSDENLSKAAGKTRNEIFKEFGNAPMPIAYVPTKYLSLVGNDVTDARIYCGKGYFIGHALRNHADAGTQIAPEDVDVSKYLNIQSVLDAPDAIKETFVDGKRTVVFIKKIGRYYAELTQVEENGRIVLHKSFFNQKKEPYAKLNDIRSNESSPEGGTSSISHAETTAPAISLQSRDDVMSYSVGKDSDFSQNGNGLGVKIAQAEAETNTEPTEAQKEAGNYKKGHVVVDGMNITIEQPKGSVRRGTDANGKVWETVMQNTYGYIRGTQSVDGDHIDIFLSDNPETGNVYVVDQVNNDGSFDEHKIMYGFNSVEEARAAYLSNYEEGWQGLGNITEVSKEDFKKWLDSSTRKTKPFAEYASTPAPAVLDNDTEGAPQDVVGPWPTTDNLQSAWQQVRKEVGMTDDYTLPNGETIEGVYVLTEAESLSPSHNPNAGFGKTKGFPVDENGNTINDRDYEFDKEAQAIVKKKAQDYDQRAVQTPVIVTGDGIVISGNDRTMSGQMAAEMGTDGKYINYITNRAAKFGFTAEQVSSFTHPRIVFVPTQPIEYNAKTFAKFNAEDKKTQNKTEQAVKLGKTISNNGMMQIAEIINNFETMSDLYASRPSVMDIVSVLQREGVIVDEQRAQLFDGNTLSTVGKDLLENVLVGGSLSEESVRSLNQMKDVRGRVVKAILQLLTNRTFGDYSLTSEISDAIEFLYKARKSGVKDNETTESFARQPDLFGGKPSEIYSATVQMIANALNKSGNLFKNFLNQYNERASSSASGQLDMFTGDVESKEQIINNILDVLYGKGKRTFTTEKGSTDSGSDEGSNASVGETEKTERGIPEEAEVAESVKSGYSVSPAQYATKRGKILDMQLVKFDRELTKEELRSSKELAKGLRGWWDSSRGGFMMRSEADAQTIVDALIPKETATTVVSETTYTAKDEDIFQMAERIAREAEETQKRQKKSGEGPVSLEKWKQMGGDERMEEADKRPLTREEIENAATDEVLKSNALDYLKGNQGMIQSISYLKVYEDVRYSNGNLAADSGAANSTQLDEAHTGSQQGLDGTTGGPRGVSSELLDSEQSEGTLPGMGGHLQHSADSEERLDPDAGERSDIPVSGEEQPVGGRPVRSRERGGSRSGDSDGRDGQPGRAGGSYQSAGDDRKRGIKTERGRNSRNGGSQSIGEDIDAFLASAMNEFEGVLEEFRRAGKEELSASLIGLSNRQLEVLPRLIASGAKVGYAYIRKGVYNFAEWAQQMRAVLGAKLVDSGLSDNEVDAFIREMWKSRLPMDGKTHTLEEWAGILGKEELRKKVGASLAEKRKAQQAAEAVSVINCDRGNIAETLPFLLPQQQDDVLKAETQFFDESHNDREHAFGKGYMFTNGTGTGKTYTGLGIVKRFIKQGKGRILILTPSQTKVGDWIKDAANLDIDLKDLDAAAKARKNGATAITEKGDGAVVTTYANFRQNKALLEDLFDLIVYDESHRLLENKGGIGTAGAMQHYKISNRNEQFAFLRLQEINPVWNDYQSKLNEFNEKRDAHIERLKKERGITNELTYKIIDELPPVLNGKWTAAKEKQFPELYKLQKEISALYEKYDNEIKPELEQQAKKNVKHTKVVFLSATPFNTRENLDYTEGYIFSYPENEKPDGYSAQSPRSQFYLEHFGAGYRWRYHRLESTATNPEAVSKQEVEFSDYLQHTLQTMSGRIIDSPFDYSRDFPTVTLDKAEEFNNAMEELSHEEATWEAYHKVMGDYNYAGALFESMKVAQIIPRLKEHLARGRKAVVFHRRVETKKPLVPPFHAIFEEAVKILEGEYDATKKAEKKQKIAALRRKYSGMLEWEQTLDLRMPREQLADAFGHNNVLFFSGQESEKAKKKAVKDFNSDTSGKNLIVIQEASGKEGISLHDTTGNHQRVLVTLALPQSPITALQIEGRIYRIGNKSNAIFEYPLLGLNTELMLFGQKFNQQVSTTENLALGSQARNLRESFARGVEEHSGDVDIDSQGVGGKEFDAPSPAEKDAFDSAVLDYYTNQKLTGKRDSREGTDYYPTPEPLGFMMGQWGRIGEGESVLEPSAGHGAIARYVPRENQLTAIEPSQSLFSKLQIKAGGNGRKFENIIFEDYNIVNKHDVVLMNPPFGTGGRLAVDHVAKAFQHLEEGGRIVAIIPRGAADKKFDKWYEEQKNAVITAEIDLPDITFERAGTSINCRVVIIDKVTNDKLREAAATRAVRVDLSERHYEKIEDFFEDIRNISVPERTIDRKAKLKKKAALTARELRAMKGVRSVRLDEDGLYVSGNGVWASIEWGERDANELTQFLADQYLKFKDNYNYAVRNERKLQEAVYDEMKDLTCRLAGMTEDEMQRYIDKSQEVSQRASEGIEDGDVRFRTFGGNSGYVGYSMSKRAQSARGEGRFPKTDFMKDYNIPANTLKALVDVGIINDNEWHHTSKFGNETTFYGWDNPLYAEFYEANKKEVDKKVKEFRSKKKPMMSDFRKEDGSIDFAALTEAEDNYNDEKFAIAEMFDNYVEKESIAEDVSEEQLFNDTVTESAVKMASSMNTDIRVVTNISELPEGAAKRAIEKGRKVKGWYDTNTGEVVLYLPNADSVEDARKTVFHEIVAHKGLREMLGDDFSTFLQNVFLNSNKKVRSKIVALASANNWNIETATEEYLATLAENGFDSEAERSYFQRIKDTLIDLLRKAGIRLGFKLSDKELRYILWRSYQMQQNKGIVGEAENVAMQSVLKVGNYAPEGDVLFRDSTAAVQIRDDYERKVSGFLNNLDEAYHDYLRSVRIAQDLIVEKSGTKIQDYEDVYKNAMRKSSMDAVEVREFHEKMADPFLKHASKMIDGKIIDGRKMTSEHIDKYLHLLHAPERNEVFARRDARRIKEEEIQKLDKQKAAGLITPADYNTAKSETEAKEQDNYKKFRENDYSGLTEMFGEGKTVQELEALAKEYTDKFEQIIGQEDIDILHNDIKQINHFILNKTYESGIISRNTMEELETMFEHYVPLRGFKDDVASDVYEYVGSEANANDRKIVKSAKGRKSTADSPIANLLVMGTNAIVAGNKNKLVKMSLLNLAENHPTDLLTVSSMWYEKQPDGTWEPKVADIPENATAKEVAQIVEAFEEDMKTKAKAKMARRRTGKSDIPLRVLNKRQEMQHAVRVMRNGTEYVVYINGNPKLAQAVNGLLNIDSTDNPIWKTARALNGFFARLNTSWSPEFIARNLARDIVASSITAAVKEGPKYTAMFEKNLMNSLSPIGVKGVRQGKFTGMYNLYVRYKNGKLDMNNPRDRYFNEFIKNGGETGITQMLTIDSYKNKMKKMVDKNGFIEFENATKAVWSSIVGGVDFLNKGVENACRFSAYMTSRQLGKSITESIYDAKEISVNFNRKGSGAMGNRLFVTNYMFFNAAMQGLFKQIDLFKKYPAKMSGLAFGLSSIAFLMALICINAGDDGDDEEMPGYFDINPFTRRGNFMVPIGDGKFAKIPLAYEVAAWYGMGDILATTLYDEYNRENTVTEIGMQLASMLPLDVVEGKNIMDPERTFLEQIGKAFIPSYAKPFAEAWGYEQDFLGRPINNRTDFNKQKPEWMRAKKSTSKFFIGLSKGITEITGGSKYKKGSIDNVIINPGSMEHLTKNLSGGFGTFIINSSKTVQALMGEEDYKDAFNVPFARSFYMNLDNEYYRNRRINDRWYYYVAESESLDFNFKMTIADPEIPKEEKDALKESYRQNGELEIMKVTKAYSKADKKYTDRIKDAEKSGREELEDKLYEMQSELRRKAVNKIDSIVEDHK